MKTRSTFQALTGWIASFLVCAGLLVTSLTASAQLTGTKTVGASGDYTTLAAAIADLNTLGVGPGGVTFDVAAGHTETFTTLAAGQINATGTVANPIVFQKSGAGSNPMITASGLGTVSTSVTVNSNGDGLIIINGGDYITIDGIDVQENVGATTAATRMEYGYMLKKASATDGCKNIVIKNCNISLQRAAAYTYGIGVTNISGTASVTVTSEGGRHENVKIFNNTITNCYVGITAAGYAHTTAPYNLRDQNIHIGVDGANNISDYGPTATTTTTYAIYGIHQDYLKIANNIITLANGLAGATTYGIFLSTAANANYDIYNNNVTFDGSQTASSQHGGIYSTMGGTGTNNVVNIYNNTLSGWSFPAMTSAAIYGLYVSASIHTLNMHGNTFSNNDFGNGATSATGLVHAISFLTGTTTAGSSWKVYNNVVSNNTRVQSTLSTGIFIAFNGTGYGVNTEIYNNQVFGNVMPTTTSNQYLINSGGAAGINKKIYNNQLYNHVGSGGSLVGILNASGDLTEIYNNNIYNLEGVYVSGSYSTIGISSSNTTTRIYNNYISDLRNTNSTSATAVAGIAVTGGTTVGVYYNTVYLNAQSTSATTFGTNALYVSSSTPVMDIRNNIFVNNSVPGPTGGNTTAFRYASATLTNIAATTNNNCYMAGTPASNSLIFWDGTNTDQTLTAYKTRVAPRENTSFTEMPPFADATISNLHLQTTTPTQCESGGQVISNINDDFDGNLRFGAPGYAGTGTAPDVGADEGEFTGLDLIPPAITFTPLLNTPLTTDRVLTATITDASGVPTTGTGLPTLYWNVNGGGYTPVAGVFVSGSTYTFTFGGGVAVGDVVSYYIAAQDNITPTANVGSFPATGATGFTQDPPAAATPPATPSTYNVVASISGVFNIGIGQDYATITDAANDLNNKYISGSVTFLLHDATWPSETFPIVFNNNPGSSYLNSVTIRPAPGVNTLISGSSSTSIIKLNGMDYLYIEGSNDNTTSRNLTITNTSTAATTAAVWISSLGPNAGANGNRISCCNLNTGSTGVTTYGVVISGATLVSEGADNDFNSIQYNLITGASYGVWCYGAASTIALGSDNLTVLENTINFNGTVTGIGITAGKGMNGLIKGNTIDFLTTASSQPVGISIETGIVDAVVDANLIKQVRTTATGGYGGRGITVGTGITNSNVTLSNNVIYGINGSNYSGFGNSSSMGIALGMIGISTTITTTAGGINVYNNSVNLFGNYSYSSACLTAALYVGTGVSNLDVRNNILANSLNNTSNASSKAYSVYSAATNAAFSQIDYNNYFVSGTQGVLCYLGSDRTTLANWQTATGKDVNSMNLDPIFVSNTDLKPSAIPLNNAGAMVPVVNDFFGILRNQPPDIGAIEFTPPQNDAGVWAVTSPVVLTTVGPAPVVVNIKNFGINPLTAVDISFQVNGGTVYTYAWTGNLAPNTIETNVTIGTFNFVDYNSTITAFTSLPNGFADEDITNDLATTSIFVCNPLAGTYTLGGAGADYPTFAIAFEKLNTCGIGGPVVFNVAADYTEAITLAASPNNFGLKLNTTGTAVNTITFQKSGSGANPLITFTGTTATNDAGIWLNGSDYVTFDGIDINDAGTAMDLGFYLAGSATNGCEGNVIKNCGITLSNTSANTNPTGVYMLSTATAASGKNSNNKFLNNTISNVFYGYRINGVSTTYYDMGNIIGNENSGNHIIQNVGYTGAATTHGINFSFQDGIEIHNVKIENIQNTSATAANNCGIQISGACANINLHHIHINQMTGVEPYGINFGGVCTGTNTFNNNLFENFVATGGNMNLFRNETNALGAMHIYSNTFRNMTQNAAANSIEGYSLNSATTFTVYNNLIYGLVNAGTGAANINGINIQNSGNNCNIFNNMIYDLQAPASTALPGTKGIRVNAGTVKLYHNTVVLNYTSTATGNASAAVHVSAVPASLEMINNIFVNKCDMTTGNLAVAFWWPSATYTALSNNTNNNIYYAGIPGAKNLIFWNGTVGDQTLLDYQTRMVTRDLGSMSEDVPFVNIAAAPWDVHIQPMATTFAESNGLVLPTVPTDIDGQLRFGAPGYAGTGLGTDLGADEFTGIAIFTCTTPAPGNTIASSTSICTGNSVTLSLQNATAGNGVQYQWKQSTDGINYNNIQGATSATCVVTPTVPMWYTCDVTCLNGPVTAGSTPVNILFTNNILSTTPGTRCGTGTVTLEATASVGANINWYNVPTGGTPIGNGNSFTTPVINTTTDFYAEAATGTVASGARPAPAATTTASALNYGLVFDAFQPFTLNTVQVYATAAGNVVIQLQNSSGTMLQSATVPVTAAGATTPQTLTLNFNISPGTGYRLIAVSSPAMVRESSLGGFPYVLGSFGSVTNGYISGTSTTYYYFYNWTLSTLCAGPRNLVTATVIPAPAITVTAGSSNLCEGQSTTLSVTSPNDPNYTYTWNPGALTGATHLVTPAATTTYTLQAVDNSGLGNDGCVNTADVVITVNPMPAPIVVTPSSSTVCEGQIVPLQAQGGFDYTKQANAYVFKASNGTFTPLAGGTAVPALLADDVISTALPIGFPFKYSGNTYTNLYASSNGFVSFNSGAASGSGNNLSTPATTMLPLIAPLWDDLDGSVTGSAASYLTTGTPGNQVFTFEWLNWEWNYQAETTVISIQMKLFETDGHIEFVYQQESGAVNNASSGASIGLAGTTSGNFLSLNGSDASPSASASTETTSIATKPATGQVYSFYPASYPVTWTPVAGLYTDPAATISYTGQNLLQVYAKPATTTTYTAQSATPANCSVSASTAVNILPLPTATTTLAATEYICPGDSKTLTVDLTGTPPWSITVDDGTGPVVVSGIMTSPWAYVVSPAVATTYTVSSVTDVNCTNTSNLSVTVDLHPLPAPVITGYTSPICADASTTLDAGSGYTTYLWSNQSAGQTLLVDGNVLGGNATAMYTVTVTNQFGCSGTANASVTTYPTITADGYTTQGENGAICPGLAIVLYGDYSGGGGGIQYLWSPGATLTYPTSQNPTAAPVITTTYTLTVKDLNNCTASDDVVITVHPVVMVDFSGLNPTYCENDPAAQLTGTPQGGYFDGAIGISSNTFTPSWQNIGTQNVQYKYTDTHGCLWIATKPVTVNALPVVSFSGLNAAYCVDAASVTLVGSPSGGNFSGPGISGSVFNPANAGTGTHTITYTYTDGNGCTNSFNAQITVNPLPVVSFTGLNSLYCITAPISNLIGSPAGGTFTGPGIVGNTFDPVLAGVGGPYTIVYTYTDGNNCTASLTLQTTVVQQLVASFTGLKAAFCLNEPTATLIGTPTGGVFSGPGIAGNTFNPVLAGVGGPYTITYTYSDGVACTSVITQEVTVHPVPVVSYTGLNATYCASEAASALSGTPAGGFFTGAGISGNYFDPTTAGAGIHAITYTFTDGNSCTSSSTQNTQVFALPVLTMSPAAIICAGFSTPISVTPAGAGGFTYLWSPAASLNNPAIANPVATPAATTTYTVTVTDINLCQNTGSVAVTVNPLPIVSFTGLNAAYCLDGSAVMLTGTPAGGTFTGPGIAGNQFNPALAGVGGPYTITYTYTDQNQCTNANTGTTIVNPLPVVTFIGLDAHYCTNSPIATLTGNPAGGTFSGTGISGNQFDPGIAGVGTHQITYTYTDGNGCTNSKTMSTLVDGIPAVTFSTLTQICVNASQISLSGGMPTGGSYSGPGVVAGAFNPIAAGSGIKTLTYTYTDGNNCTNFATHNILVHALTPLTFPALTGVCITEAPFALSTATPAGGTYSGTGVTANIFDPAAAGAGTHTITYTYTDGNNCTNSITQTIQVYALPNVVMSSNTSICIGSSTQLNVTPFGGGGGYSFLWNNATLLNSATISNPVATPVNTTTFTVTVTDIRGCKRTGSTTITVNPLPALTLNPSTNMCQGSNTQLNVQVTPAGTYAYNWSNGASLSSTTISNPVATPAVTTTYTVTVTNTSTSCISTAQTVVTVLPNPVPVITGLNANYCVSAAPVTLTGNPAGGIFTINGIPAVQLDPAAVGVGGHTVAYSVTQANNCVASINQTVNVRALPVADAGQDQSVCTGFQVNLNASASGGAPPYQYLWSPAAQVSNPNIANPVTNPATTTTYTVVVTDLYGCSSSDEVVVNTTSTPVANAGPDVTICKGQGAQLQASGGTTYAWVPSTGLNNANISDPIASPAVTTTYNVIVVSNCGIAADQVVVTVLPLPSVNFTGLPANACINGTPISLTGIPAGGVFSGPGITGNVFDPAQAGGPGIVDISYTISGSNGCDNTITKSVHVRPMTTGTILNLASLYCASGNGVTLSGIPAGGTFAGPGMAGNMFNPAMAGVGVHTIIYTFSDQYGCLNTITQQTTVYAPIVNITNLAPDYCVNGAAVTLTSTPAGGIFSGTGMNGAKFVPSVAGVGTHNITYWAQDGNNCWGTITLSTIVLPPTPVSFTGLAPTYCTNDPIATLTPSPAGGTFSGPGIVGNTFNPATSSTGTRVIWYTVSGPGFCKNSVTQTTVVSPVPAVSFSGLNNSYCVSALPVNLSFAPAGGTFTGNGMTGNVFTPASAGAGNHTITYSFTSAAGCTNSMTRTTLVNPLPNVSFSGLNATYCINDGPALLAGSPAGGYFNGPGIQYGIYFNPTLAGIGTHTITYSYKDVNQCTNVASATVTVTALPTATFQIPAGVCIDAAPVTLNATPAGGVFSGPGVVNGVFFPNIAGTGIHTLSYSLSNANGCSGVLTTTIQVYSLPSVTISYVKTNHCNNAAPVTLAGNPAGGTFTGNGMVGNVFHPALAGVGTHVITYTFTNANGCTKTATRTLNVIAAPVVSFTGLASAYCINEPTVTLTGTPAGGYFSGPGAGLTSFSPLSAGPGTHTITYTLSLNGCTSTASQQVTVNPLPVVSFVNVPSTYCINQGPLTLNATPAGGTFTFTGNGLTGNILDPVVAGVGGYTLFYAYTDPVTGCSRTIKMVMYIRPVSAATLIGPATVCQSGAPVVMSGSPANPAGTYTGPGMSGNLFNPGVAGAGTHTVTYNYTNGFGCVTMANHSVTVLAGPTLTLPATSTVCSNQTITLTADPGAASYIWSTGASTQSIVVDGAVLGLGTHNISVTATNAQGCSSTATTALAVISCKIDGTAGITESVTAYPNPSSGIYKLTLSHFTGNTEMSVFNELGQLITRETLQTGEGDTFIKELDLSVLPSGVYTVKFTNEKATRAIKLILQ